MQNNTKLYRRNFLKKTFAVGAATLLTPSISFAAESKNQDNEDFKILVGPYLQTAFNNSITIHWVTSKNANSWVEFGTDANNLNQKAQGKVSYGLKPEGRINKVTLKNLVPSQTYFYRIVSKEIKDFQPYKLTYGSVVQSEVNCFKNADVAKKEISFLMLNDIHDRPKSIPFLLRMDDVSKQDFVFFNGDIFDYQTDEKQIIDHMLQPCVDAFATKTPFVYVRGNHETRGKFRDEFLNYFENVGRLAFTLGPVRFVILDTGEDKEDTHPVYADLVDFDGYRLDQAEWLKEEMRSKAFKKAPFRVVMMHIPPRFSGNAHGAVHCNAVFEPLLNAGKVDLVLSGHTHKYMVHHPNEGPNKYPLIIGGGPTEGKRTLTKITATDRQLNVSMIGDNGNEVGNYIVNR